MQEAQIDKMGLKINGKKLNEISYADDKVLIAESEAQMQRMIDRVKNAGLKYCMKINVNKTKIMKFSKNDDKKVRIKVGTQEVEKADEFRYMGALISNNGRDNREIKTRIGMTKNAFNNLARVLGNSNYS